MARMGDAMNKESERSLQELALEIFQRKKERRRQLAKLSFEEKIDIMVRMQNLVSQIGLQTRGTCRKPWWKTES
jgi:hypothetical protein